MTRIYTIILASYVALLLVASGTVAAQETATASALIKTTAAATLTTTPGSLNETTHYNGVADNCMVQTVSVEYVDGTAVFILESGLPRAVTVTVPTGSTSTDVTTGNLARRLIPPGRTTIRVDSPEPRMTLVTSYSVKSSRYIEIRFSDGGSASIAGPFTGTDV